MKFNKELTIVSKENDKGRFSQNFDDPILADAAMGEIIVSAVDAGITHDTEVTSRERIEWACDYMGIEFTPDQLLMCHVLVSMALASERNNIEFLRNSV